MIIVDVKSTKQQEWVYNLRLLWMSSLQNNKNGFTIFDYCECQVYRTTRMGLQYTLCSVWMSSQVKELDRITEGGLGF